MTFKGLETYLREHYSKIKFQKLYIKKYCFSYVQKQNTTVMGLLYRPDARIGRTSSF
jgi:hypothetical protein